MTSDNVLSELRDLVNQKLDKYVTVNGKTFCSGNIILTPNDLGLGSVSNIEDADRPVSNAVQNALEDKVDKNVLICGYPLAGDVNLSRQDIQGLDKIDNTGDLDKPISVAVQRALDGKMNKYVSVCGYALSSDVYLNKADVGLANVDNTSDVDKPVSRATQLMLRSLQASVDANVTTQTSISNRLNNFIPLNRKVCGYELSQDVNLDRGDVGLANVDNTSDVSKPLSFAAHAALDLKVDKSTTLNGYSLSGNVNLDKADVGLANVDNTSDISKPVSGPVQAALSLKVPKTTTINNHSLDSNVVLDKSDVGLGSVDNTSDANKPISSATQLALNLKENMANKNVANGYAGLDSSGKVALAQLPIAGLTYRGTWNAFNNTPPLASNVGNAGDYYKVSTAGTTSLNGVSVWSLGDWAIYSGTAWQKVSNTDSVSSVNGRSGAVVIAKSDVGLGNVDNTSDANKPVSGPTATALGNKVDKTTTVCGKALSSNVLVSKSDVGLNSVDNTSDENKPLSLASRVALASKVDKLTTVNGYSLVGNVSLAKTDVGLGSVDNTPDANKPVSAPMLSALNLKENIANKNVANGYAGLDASGKVAMSQMPITGLAYKGTWNAATNTPALVNSVGVAGNYYKVSVSGATMLDGLTNWHVGDWVIFNGSGWDKIDNTELVSSVNGYAGAVVITKSDVGLGSVDNTSDASKPLSAAALLALGNKVDKTTTVCGKALNSNISLSKADVGLGSADNTPDSAKPISSFVQAALNNKQNVLISGTNIKTVNGGTLLGEGDLTFTIDTKSLVYNGVTQSIAGSGSLDLQTTLTYSVWLDTAVNALPLGKLYLDNTANKTFSNGVVVNYISDTVIDVVVTGMCKLIVNYMCYFANWNGGNFVCTLNVVEVESSQTLTKALNFSMNGNGTGYGWRADSFEANLPILRLANWVSTYRISLTFNNPLAAYGGCIGIRLL